MQIVALIAIAVAWVLNLALILGAFDKPAPAPAPPAKEPARVVRYSKPHIVNGVWRDAIILAHPDTSQIDDLMKLLNVGALVNCTFVVPPGEPVPLGDGIFWTKNPNFKDSTDPEVWFWAWEQLVDRGFEVWIY